MISRSALGWWFAAVALVACGGSSESVDPVEPTKPVMRPARSEVEVRAAVEAMLRLQHEAIRDRDIGAWSELLAEDAFVFGSAPHEAAAGRDEVVAMFKKFFDPLIEAGATFDVMASDVAIGVAPNRRAAWAAEEVDFDIRLGNKAVTIPFRMTAVVEDRGRSFRIVAQHWSVGVPNDKAMGTAAQGKWPALAPVEDSVPPGAEGLRDVIDGYLADGAALVAAISDHRDVFGFGSAPDEKIRGASAARAALGQEGSKWSPKMVRNGGIRIGLSGDGKNAWAAFNIDYSATLPGNNRVTQPFRILAFLVQDEEGTWKIVQWHASNGVPDELPK